MRRTLRSIKTYSYLKSPTVLWTSTDDWIAPLQNVLFVWVLTYSIPRPKLSAPPSNHRFNICSKTRLPSSQPGGGARGAGAEASSFVKCACWSVRCWLCQTGCRQGNQKKRKNSHRCCYWYGSLGQENWPVGWLIWLAWLAEVAEVAAKTGCRRREGKSPHSRLFIMKRAQLLVKCE